jgi:hypothetical protein
MGPMGVQQLMPGQDAADLVRRNIAELREREAEIKNDIEVLDKRIEELSLDFAPASRLAEKVLSYSGRNESLEEKLSFGRRTR